MQCVPWPWPSCGGSPATNDCAVTLRPAKSGCEVSKPVSRTATRMPLPDRGDEIAWTAWMPHVACGVSANGRLGRVGQQRRSPCPLACSRCSARSRHPVAVGLGVLQDALPQHVVDQLRRHREHPAAGGDRRPAARSSARRRPRRRRCPARRRPWRRPPAGRRRRSRRRRSRGSRRRSRCRRRTRSTPVSSSLVGEDDDLPPGGLRWPAPRPSRRCRWSPESRSRVDRSWLPLIAEMPVRPAPVDRRAGLPGSRSVFAPGCGHQIPLPAAAAASPGRGVPSPRGHARPRCGERSVTTR